jgi:hypothetical protein
MAVIKGLGHQQLAVGCCGKIRSTGIVTAAVAMAENRRFRGQNGMCRCKFRF